MEHGEDRFKACQEPITRDQLLEFNVSGKQGFPSRYDLKLDEQDLNNLIVTDSQSRSMWINFVRIVNYCVKSNGQSQDCLSYAVASNSLSLFFLILPIFARFFLYLQKYDEQWMNA